jgi:hypothetical protein
MGLNMKERQVVTREYKGRYQKAVKKKKKKEKRTLLDEFTRLTGYYRKSAIRLLSARPPKTALVYAAGKAVKLKPAKSGLRLKGKSLTKPLNSLKSRIPIRTFYTGGERCNARFLANRRRRTSVRHHCGQATRGQYDHTLTATDAASGWMRTFVPRTPFPPQ